MANTATDVENYIQDYYNKYGAYPDTATIMNMFPDIVNSHELANAYTDAVYKRINGSSKNVSDKGVNNNNNKKLTWDFVDPYTGKVREVSIGGSSYKYDNLFRRSRNTDVYYAIQYMLKYGSDVDSEKLRSYIKGQSGNNVTKGEMDTIIEDALTFFGQENIDLNDLGTFDLYKNSSSTMESVKQESISTGTEEGTSTSTEDEEGVDYNNKAMDKYWEDLFSLDQGTLGADMMNRLTTAEQNAALSNMQLADAQFQQASMQQAAVVKDIVDQVKAERNAKLRAGMSEAQIANQDMQIMLNNMNTMNQQMNTMNQNRLTAQQQYGLAQDTAYQAYLQNAQGLAQSGAAYSAANAGDPYYQALLYSMQTGKPFTTSHQNVTGYNNNTTK